MNFPIDFEVRMQQQLGAEWQAFATAHTTSSPISIRLNPEKSNRKILENFAKQGIDHQNIPWTKNSFYLNKRPIFTLDPTLHGGAYYVQEASSMLLEQAIRQYSSTDEPIHALDLCAAPGGKSTHLLSLLSQDSLVVSNEVIRTRANILSENILKWGYSNSIVTNNDPQDFGRLPGFFDLMVIDAPCSGEGLFRKDAEAMKEWSLDNAALCSARQQRIVHDCWSALKENGILIYCTCTYNTEENEENVSRFAKELEAEILPLEIDNTWGIRKLNCGYQCFPHQVNGEGFYIAVLRKKSLQQQVRQKITKHIFQRPDKINVHVKDWLKNEKHAIVQFKDYLLALPKDLTGSIEFISSHLKIVHAGTTLGTVKQNKVIPDHALALSIHLNVESFASIEVNRDDSLTYLRKDNLWKEGVSKGFTLVNYEGLNLGWLNVLDNRFNNLYPAEWRIRMAGNS